jgi:TonB family protein
MSLGEYAMTARAVFLTFIALAAPAHAQTGDQDQPVYQYGTPAAGLGVYADTGHQVGVAIVSGDSGNRAQFAATKAQAWLDHGMADSLAAESTNDPASLSLIRRDGTCTLRLSQKDHADNTITVPCLELPAFADGMRRASGQQRVYFDFQVEKQAGMMPGNPTPKYPESLRRAMVSGQVLAQFVVDTNGLAELSTFKVLKSTNPQFDDAVWRVLPDMRFTPARIGGHKVKQLVQEPFSFAIH